MKDKKGHVANRGYPLDRPAAILPHLKIYLNGDLTPGRAPFKINLQAAGDAGNMKGEKS